MYFPRNIMPPSVKEDAPNANGGSIKAADFNRLTDEARSIETVLGASLVPPGAVYQSLVDANAATNADEDALLDVGVAQNVLSLIARLIEKTNQLSGSGILAVAGYANSGQRMIFPEAAQATFLSSIPASSDTVISVFSTAGFPDNGVLTILNDVDRVSYGLSYSGPSVGQTMQEWIRYTSKTPTQFLNCERGYLGTTIGPHLGSYGLLDTSSSVAKNIADHCVVLPDEDIYCSRRYPAWRFRSAYSYAPLRLTGSLIDITRFVRANAGRISLSAAAFGMGQLGFLLTTATTQGILGTNPDGSNFLKSATLPSPQLTWTEANSLVMALLGAKYIAKTSSPNDAIVPQLAIPVFGGKMSVQSHVAAAAVNTRDNMSIIQTADARLYLAILPAPVAPPPPVISATTSLKFADGVLGYETFFVSSPRTNEEAS